MAKAKPLSPITAEPIEAPAADPVAEIADVQEPSTTCSYCGLTKAKAPVELDPSASVVDCLAAIAELTTKDLPRISAALSKFVRKSVGDVFLHAKLHRMELALGEARHTLSLIDAGHIPPRK